MQVEFILPIKAFSINAYHYATRKVKTKEAREWEELVQSHLDNEKALIDLADTWRKSGGSFEVHIEIMYPHHIFYNKQGCISSKTFDISNTEKLIIDRVFLDRMDVDDRFIVKLVSTKVSGHRHQIKVTIIY